MWCLCIIIGHINPSMLDREDFWLYLSIKRFSFASTFNTNPFYFLFLISKRMQTCLILNTFHLPFLSFFIRGGFRQKKEVVVKTFYQALCPFGFPFPWKKPSAEQCSIVSVVWTVALGTIIIIWGVYISSGLVWKSSFPQPHWLPLFRSVWNVGNCY